MRTGKTCTITDIAEYANVSRSTVSRVLNNVRTKVPVSAETRARIAEAVRHFDYSPNANARRLSINKSWTIGLQVPAHHLNRYVFSDYNLIGAMHGIEAALLSSDYKLLLLFESDKYMRNQEYLAMLKSKSIDGLLIWGATRSRIYDHNLKNYPVILLNTLPDEHGGFNFICHDDYRGSYDLTAELISRGAGRFAYLCGPTANSITVNRYRGFRDALAHRNLPFDEESALFHGDFHRASARQVGDRLFPGGQVNFDAIVCSNDMMATGIYESALAAGLRPDADFLLAGADGVEDCADYPLSTFAVDHFSMGFEAINQLIGLIEGDGAAIIEKYIKPALKMKPNKLKGD